MKRVLFFLIAVIFILPAGCIFDKSEDSDNESITIDHVVINEVFYAKNDMSTDNAWAELYNPTDNDVDISFWKIADKVIAPTINCLFFFPENTTIKSKEFILVVAKSDSFFAHFTKPENVKMFSACTVSSVENDGLYLQNIEQKNSFQLTAVDSVDWGLEGASSVETWHSLARYAEWPDTDDHQEDFYDESIPSPGMENRKRD